MKVIVLNSELQPKHVDMIKDAAGKAGADVFFAGSEDDIPEEYADAEVIYGFGMKTAAQSRSLKWLCVPSAGVEFLLKPGVFANEDCIVTNAAGAYGVSISEHIVMVTLMLMRQMPVIYKQSLAGEWGMRLPQKSLKNCRITVLGTGDIGSNFARRAKAFDPRKLVGVCRTGVCEEPVFDAVYKTGEFDKVLPETDLLVMSLPDTAETRGILSAKRINKLPAGAYVVNVGRGSAIDDDALADALDEGRLGGAALDVFKQEPLPEDSRLWKTRNLIVTPHVAGILTLEYTMDRNVEMFCEDLINYAEDKPLKYLIDKKLGY